MAGLQLRETDATSPPERARDDSKSDARRLTARAIEALKPKPHLYEVTDPACAGLQLRVLPTGAKTWFFRFYWQHKRKRLALGNWPDTSLVAAHERVTEARGVLNKGIDPRKAGIVKRTRSPIAEPAARDPETAGVDGIDKREKLDTDLSDDPNDIPGDPHSVKFLAHEFHYRHLIRERKRKRPGYAKRILNRDVLPFWANRDARTITPREVIKVLDRVVDRGSPVMANRVADVVGQMFKYGIHQAIVDDSPVKLLYKPGGTEKPRARALSHKEQASLLLNYKTVCRTRRAGHILMALLLTMQRRQELALAKKSEFDLENLTWAIPDEHAKNGRGHMLPLTKWAADEIRALIGLSSDSVYLLPRKNGKRPINPMLITRSIARLQHRFQNAGVKEFTPHDLRRTGRTGLGELGIDDKIAERVLNHTKKKMSKVYDQWEYFKEKKDALEKWAQFLSERRNHGLAEAKSKAHADHRS